MSFDIFGFEVGMAVGVFTGIVPGVPCGCRRSSPALLLFFLALVRSSFDLALNFGYLIRCNRPSRGFPALEHHEGRTHVSGCFGIAGRDHEPGAPVSSGLTVRLIPQVIVMRFPPPSRV